MNKFIKFPYQLRSIDIILGYNCNFNCKYCVQHNIKKKYKSYNPDIINFILETIKRRKTSKKIEIQFFGGEPLLYFDTIKQIVQDLRKESDKIQYSMITNGSLLNEETISFINEHNISVSISWDGRNTKLSRGIDVFETNKDNIFKLKNGFDVRSVLNAYNSPLEVLQDIENLNKEYYKIYNCDLDFNISLAELIDSKNTEYFIKYDLYINDIINLFDKLFTHKNITNFEYRYIQNILQKLLKKRSSAFINCGKRSINMDLQGSLFFCKNTYKKIGTIYTKYKKYKLNRYNIISKHMNYYLCKQCNLNIFCTKCCILSPKEYQKQHCLYNKLTIPILLNKIYYYIQRHKYEYKSI